MLTLNKISMLFGERTLFRDVSLSVGPHARIGLVGSNGAGKSTLLRIVVGIQEPTSGTLSKAHYVTVGYLPQDGVVSSGRTLYTEVEAAFESVIEVQEKLREAQEQLGVLEVDTPQYNDTLEVVGEMQSKLENLDAYRMKARIERILMGLGFAVSDFERDTEEFSGGWHMRIELAKLLLKEPSVLLLDEPTNHLDLESLQWLETYLGQYNGAVILVSHDRALLDRLTTSTLSLSLGKAELYAGNYSFFVQESDKRRELTLKAYKNQQQKLKQSQVFIDRFRYKATKARQVQSRIKQLEKMEKVEIEDEESQIGFEFPPPLSSGRVVMELRGITKSYGDLRVFKNLDLDILRGDRIAVVGVNGAGKSTLARILAGIEPFESGERIPGHNVSISYFGQHQAEELDLSADVLEVLDRVAGNETRTRLRTILGTFLFSGDDAFKKVSVLSGGERSRLALARMLLQPSNFLIMDEPTNHLDMRSKDVLANALRSFEGSFLIVSHDRSFLQQIVTKVFDVQHHTVSVYPGTLSEFIDRRTRDEEETRKEQFPSREQPGNDRDRKRIEAEKRQQLYTILRPFRARLNQLENDINDLERRKAAIETLMADPDFYKNGDEAKRTSLEYRELTAKLDEAYVAWDRLNKEIEAHQQRFS